MRHDCGRFLLHLQDCMTPIINFHCGGRIDSGGRIKYTRSLVSAQTCLDYNSKWVSCSLSHGRATFIRVHATLIKNEGLLRNFCIICMGCVFSMFFFCIGFKVELVNRSVRRKFTCHTRSSYDVTFSTTITEIGPTATG